MSHSEDATPPGWREIDARTRAAGFDMPSEPGVGALLRTLAAVKRGGRLLELGTGSGLATAWLVDGMDADARLISIDNDAAVQSIGRSVLGGDPRLTFIVGDGLAWLAEQADESFDLVFADAWPGKYEGVEDALRLLAPGGLYVVDDMLPQRNWPEGHQVRVDALVAFLENRADLAITRLDWASGLIMAARR